MGFERFIERNKYFEELLANKNLCWLGQNTNHIKPHPSVLEAMRGCIDSGEFHLYAPPLGLEELRHGILDDLGIDSETFQAVVTDGAIEGLYHICHTLLRPGDEIIVSDPGWPWPQRFASEAGAHVIEIPVYGEGTGYRIAPAALESVVTEKTRLIYLVDPNNPIGSIQTPDEIKAIADIARRYGAYVVHDCTYRHFAEGHTLLAPYYPEGTITTYSFSKWLGLAGLRIGAVIACNAVLELLANAPPNNLGSSMLAQRAAIAGLAIKSEWFLGVQSAQRSNQVRIRDAAEAVGNYTFPVFPSNGNFLLMDMGDTGVTPEALCQSLLKHNVLIRQGSYQSRLFGDRFVKISTTVPEAWVDAFCTELPEATKAALNTSEPSILY